MAGKKGRRSLMSALEGGGGGVGMAAAAAAVVGKTGRKKSRTPKKGATPRLTCKRKVPETPVRGLAASAGEIRLQFYNYTHKNAYNKNHCRIWLSRDPTAEEKPEKLSVT